MAFHFVTQSINSSFIRSFFRLGVTSFPFFRFDLGGLLRTKSASTVDLNATNGVSELMGLLVAIDNLNDSESRYESQDEID